MPSDDGGVGERSGTLRDTYLAALQNGHVEPAEDDLVVGVVAEPMYGLQAVIDRNIISLAPPKSAVRTLKKLTENGMDHNEAVAEFGLQEQYRAGLQNSAQRRAMRHLIHELNEGRDVWLVCYENTDEKWCHREVLKEEIEDYREVLASAAN